MQKIILKLTLLTMLVLLATACSKKTTAIESSERTAATVEERENRTEQRADQVVPKKGEGKGQGKGQRPKYADLLTKMDANKDGKISASEVKGPLKENFSKIDSDNDGFLSEKEFNNAPPPPPRGGRN